MVDEGPWENERALLNSISPHVLPGEDRQQQGGTAL